MKLLERLPENLLKVLEEPPYSQFFFIGSIFVAIALVFDKNFNIVWLFFLLSVVGTILRYIERDFLGLYEVKRVKGLSEDKIKIRSRILKIYHISNLLWIVALIFFLWVNN